MSYASESRRSGREPFTLVELDLDRCTREFGTAPCQAILGITGSTYCFKTRATCQDPANYVPEVATVRFCSARAPLPRIVTADSPPVRVAAIPSIRSVDLAPTKIDVSGGLGQRASVQITLDDHTHHDRGFDPYWDQRRATTADESLQALSNGSALQALSDGTELLARPAGSVSTYRLSGTFWGRMRARQPYYLSRVCRVITGYIVDGTFSVGDAVTRTYLLESIAGPDSGGKVQIKAKDPLKLADNDRAQAPRASNGRLLSAINQAVTSATLTPTGIGDAEYPSTGYARIGSEVVEFTRSGDSLTLERAQFGTTADSHDTDDTVQLCLRYAAQLIPAMVYDLLTTYADTDPAYLPLAEWEAEAALYLTRTYSTLITEPTSVATLLKELTQQAVFTLYYSEREALVKLKALRVPNDSAPTLNDRQHLLADSLQVTDKPELRVSQAWIYLAQSDPTEALDSVRNYRQLVITADLEAEGVNKFRAPAIRKVFSRWITSRANAQEACNALVGLFGEQPRQVSFSLDAKDASLWTGDIVRLSTRLVQNFDGANAVLPIQIIEADEDVAGHRFKYVGQAFNFVSAVPEGLVISIAEDDNGVNLLDLFTARYGAPTADTVVLFVIEGGVTIGWETGALAALRTGTWPLGATVSLENNGRVQGYGGRGAKIGSVRYGTAGGTAFYVDSRINVSNYGQIWGGGGGGHVNRDNDRDYGGGGGSGTPPGEGGIGTGSRHGLPGTSDAGGLGKQPGGSYWSANAGGGPGLAGNSQKYGPGTGGPAGKSVVGTGLVTWVVTGDVRGPQI